MKLVASAALAPLVAGTPFLIGTFLANKSFDGAGMMFGIVLAGLPFATILSVLATYFLQSDDLFRAKRSLFYCSLLGAFFAAVATLGMLELSPYFWGVVSWGALSGAVFRRLLGPIEGQRQEPS